MVPYQQRMNTSRVAGDVFKRSRFRQHTKSMATEGQGTRLSERELAHERLGRDFTEAEEGMWHNYVAKGGKKPSFGGGPGFGGEGMPMGPAPELNLPEYDEDKVSSLTQKRAAPGVRRLREATRSAMSETYDNPNVKRMTVRDALSGYGTGLENVMAGAGRSATQEYGQQYAASVNAEMTRFKAAVGRQSQLLDISSRAWLMEKEYDLAQEYEDPYDAFNKFYGGGGGSGRGGSSGGTVLSELQRTRPQRDKEWSARPFSRAR